MMHPAWQNCLGFTAMDRVMMCTKLFEEWQAKHGPNGGAYDIEMQRAGWNGAMANMAARDVVDIPSDEFWREVEKLKQGGAE